MGERLGVASVLAAAVVAVALGATACTSGTGTSSSDSARAPRADASTASEAGLEAAATTFFGALVEFRFADAYAMYSAECRQASSEADFVRRMTRNLNTATSLNGEVAAVVGDAQVAEMTATSGKAAVEIRWGDNLQSSGWEPFVYEDGAWRFDDCDFGVDKGD